MPDYIIGDNISLSYANKNPERQKIVKQRSFIDYEPEVTQISRSGRYSTRQTDQRIFNYRFGLHRSFTFLKASFYHFADCQEILISLLSSTETASFYIIARNFHILLNTSFLVKEISYGLLHLFFHVELDREPMTRQAHKHECEKGSLYTGHINLYRAQTTLPMRLNNIQNTVR